ncbi:MAG TPA: TlpA disulfide reductase family protein [Gammaproteobacteria bacterium]|nr:TlpA disulfide reductase family protein [Gammaproteobacteria bacterium]
MARIHLTLLLLVLGTAGTAGAQPSEDVPIGGTLRDATLRGLNGPPRKLSEFLGKPLIINVWASWCGPCRAEMASLERLAWRDESRDLTIIGISTDDYEDRASAALTSSNATITHFIDRNLLMEKMLGASRLPLTVLIAPDGRVLDKIYGAREWDSAAALAHVDKVLRGRSEDTPAR